MSTPAEPASYDVRIWAARKYSGRRKTTYNVRWRAGSKTHSRTFGSSKAAESFRAELLTAHRKGEPFDVGCGLPPSMRPTTSEVTWLEHACDFVDNKWSGSSPRHRKGIAEALTTVTMVLWAEQPDPRPAPALRSALNGWAFNKAARPLPLDASAPPAGQSEAVAWMTRRSLPISALMDPVVVRRALEACATKLDGSRAAASTTARKKSAFYGALRFGLELGRLPNNPLAKLSQRRSPGIEAVDRRVVVNPDQARRLIGAVRELHPSLEAFFACLHYAGLRPSEARHLRVTDLHLPDEGWGELILAGSTQASGRAWTDGGSADEDRSLKHRSGQAVRQVPAHPELVEILRRHLTNFECSPDGRLFVSRTAPLGRPLPRPFSKPLPMGTVYRVWGQARQRVLTPQQVASPLAKRPYDLRHACVSTWLNAGSPPLRSRCGPATASTSSSASTPSASTAKRSKPSCASLRRCSPSDDSEAGA